MKLVNLLFVLGNLWFLNSCTAEKVSPIQKDNTNITYSKDISPFITTHCISCHDPSCGIQLTNYTQVKAFGESSQLMGCITGDPNYLKMPPNETLSSSEIQLVHDWVVQGMKE